MPLNATRTPRTACTRHASKRRAFEPLSCQQRWHYDLPIPALLTAMTIFSGEWAAVLYEGLAADVVPRLLTILFVVLALLVGHFVVINLFVAELVNAFVSEERYIYMRRTPTRQNPSLSVRPLCASQDLTVPHSHSPAALPPRYRRVTAAPLTHAHVRVPRKHSALKDAEKKKARQSGEKAAKEAEAALRAQQQVELQGVSSGAQEEELRAKHEKVMGSGLKQCMRLPL